MAARRVDGGDAQVRSGCARRARSESILLLVSWGAIGFAGFGAYPDLLERLEEVVGEDSYTAYIVGLDLGLSSPAARALWLVVGLGLLAAVVLSRVGVAKSERPSFSRSLLRSL